MFALSDAAAIYLFSVHFNLFGGSVLKLGTDRHHKRLLDLIDTMDGCPGCFALTECAHGVISYVFIPVSIPASITPSHMVHSTHALGIAAYVSPHDTFTDTRFTTLFTH